MQETWVGSQGWEDLLEQEKAIHSSSLAWKLRRQRSSVGYSPRGCRVRHDWVTKHANIHISNVNSLRKAFSWWNGLIIPIKLLFYFLYSICHLKLCYLLIYCFNLSAIRIWQDVLSLWQEVLLLLYTQYIEQQLAHGRCSINI